MNPEKLRKIIMKDPDTFARELILILDDFIKKNDKAPVSAYDEPSIITRCESTFIRTFHNADHQRCALGVRHVGPHVTARGLSFNYASQLGC